MVRSGVSRYSLSTIAGGGALLAEDANHQAKQRESWDLVGDLAHVDELPGEMGEYSGGDEAGARRDRER